MMLIRRAIAFFAPLLLLACDFDDVPSFVPESTVTNYRQEMRELVQDISRYARGRDRDFIIIPQNGVELVTTSGRVTATVEIDYLSAIDGIAQEGVFFGLEVPDQPTPAAESARLRDFLDIARERGNVSALVTDFAFSERNVDQSILLNDDAGYLGFAAPRSELDTIPDYPNPIPGSNRADIEDLNFARNFLHLTNPQLFSSSQELVDALANTDYDVVILDFFFNGESFTAEQIRQLRFKANGGRRLLLAYLSIGQAESNRFYWQNFWSSNPPSWLREEVAGSPGNYQVRYWLQPWKNILFGEPGDYVDRIIDAGFDGAYLDHLDEYQYFEAQ
ncbi:endo alpha-1,4 polygalactosaminidase [Microbulbifer guangxiensis]|uniref:endo alpha-1,4 polygalactosaminidase n=1 Tax=Microbulbifer guangxiensis TaxID=2904249 RepID=UPI001F39CC5B|nr:endo alpha-1,4 polygalactosaminidase [Microbulbifer guangxiensis]